MTAMRNITSPTNPVPSPPKVDLPGKCGEHQLRNQEVFYGKREQTDAGVSA